MILFQDNRNSNVAKIINPSKLNVKLKMTVSHKFENILLYTIWKIVRKPDHLFQYCTFTKSLFNSHDDKLR